MPIRDFFPLLALAWEVATRAGEDVGGMLRHASPRLKAWREL